MYKRNMAEQVIHTWNNHFVAVLISLDKMFPMYIWERLIQQTYITPNLLRPSWRNPKISAYAMLEGQFDFNKNSLAPPGTRLIVQKDPAQ